MNLSSREPRNVKFALADGDAQARPRLKNRRDEMDTTMRELTDAELYEVAGGDPFGIQTAVAATVINSGSFAVGAAIGDNSVLTAVTMAFAGQINTVGPNIA
jgi:hypothetical protein